jgi:hypothetical protein
MYYIHTNIKFSRKKRGLLIRFKNMQWQMVPDADRISSGVVSEFDAYREVIICEAQDLTLHHICTT